MPILALLALGLSPLTVRGGMIVSNLAASPGTFSPVTITGDTFWAQQFTSGVAADLTQIITQLGNFNPGFDANGDPGDFTITASLVSTTSASTFPDAGTLQTFFSFDVSTIPTSGFDNIAFTPLSTVTLDPSLFYWFVLIGGSTNPPTSPNQGSVDWQFADTADSTGPGLLTGTASFFEPGPWSTDPQGPGGFLIEVQGVNAVPEPASWLMGTVGLSALAALTGLKRRRRAG